MKNNHGIKSFFVYILAIGWPLLAIIPVANAAAKQCQTYFGIQYTSTAVLAKDLPELVLKKISQASQDADYAYQNFLKRNKFKSDFEAQESARALLEDPQFTIIKEGVTNRRITVNLLRARFSSDIRNRNQADVTIREIPEIKGRGVFAKSAIKKGSYIGEYGGTTRVIDMIGDVDNMYLMETPFTYKRKKVIIDGQTEGNFGRFLNHSSLEVTHPKGVNAVFKEMIFEGRPLVVIFAARDISPGEQILINYGHAYWEGLGVDPLLFE